MTLPILHRAGMPLVAVRFAGPTLVLLGALLLAGLYGRHEWKHIELSPDSSQYHFLAVNMMQGKGYLDYPVGDIADYDPITVSRFSPLDVHEAQNPSMGRAPGYPLFLRLIYSLHGINPDFVLPYQILITGFIGGLMVLAGWLMLGIPGALAGLVAVFVMGMNRDASYPTYALLSECLSTFFLTAAATAAAWAKKGRWSREAMVSVLFALAILTRPGLLFVGITYGIILLFQSVFQNPKRVIAFALPCVLMLSVWSFIATTQSGHFVPLGGNAAVNVAAGLDPVGTANRVGLKPPSLDIISLQQFWYSFPGGEHEDISRLVAEIPGRWREVLKITVIKVQAATNWVPRPLWAMMLIGFLVTGSLTACSKCCALYSSQGVLLNSTGIISKKGWIEVVFAGTAGLAFLTVLGYSGTWLQGMLILLALASPFFRFQVYHLDGCSRNGKDNHTKEANFRWILSWFFGFIIMTLLAFGIPRFMRPYLPVFYLVAALLPLIFCMMILSLRSARLEVGSQLVQFKFRSS